jgi:FkbM family methyltransferase
MILNLDNLKTTYNCEFNGVLHIGAHHGEEYHTYARLNINPVVFIEAVPDTFNYLIQRVPTEHCMCINTAVGNMDGEIEMFISNTSPCSSILEPGLHIDKYPEITFENKTTVKISKIDSLNIPQCNFLNIDVQGYELEVLKGASDYLYSVDYIMTEVNRDSTYKNCAMVDEIDSFLAPYGFTRVETDWAGDIWGDAFYIKSKK